MADIIQDEDSQLRLEPTALSGSAPLKTVRANNKSITPSESVKTSKWLSIADPNQLSVSDFVLHHNQRILAERMDRIESAIIALGAGLRHRKAVIDAVEDDDEHPAARLLDALGEDDMEDHFVRLGETNKQSLEKPDDADGNYEESESDEPIAPYGNARGRGPGRERGEPMTKRARRN